MNLKNRYYRHYILVESNEISLDEAVKAYERGSKLKNICQERLNEAKMKVEKIKDFDKDEI